MGTMKEAGEVFHVWAIIVTSINYPIVILIRLCVLSFSRPRTLASAIVDIYDRGGGHSQKWSWHGKSCTQPSNQRTHSNSRREQHGSSLHVQLTHAYGVRMDGLNQHSGTILIIPPTRAKVKVCSKCHNVIAF